MKNQPAYGLEVEVIDNILSKLTSNPKISKIILFGSRAKGTFRAGSDVDLALVGSELNLDDILNASLEVETLLLPYKFDFVLYHRIKESELTEHIDRVGVVLFER